MNKQGSSPSRPQRWFALFILFSVCTLLVSPISCGIEKQKEVIAEKKEQPDTGTPKEKKPIDIAPQKEDVPEPTPEPTPEPVQEVQPEPIREAIVEQKPTAPHPLMKQVDASKYETDLTKITVVRDPKSKGWQMTQDLCASRFAQLGYQVELHKYGTGVNVIGVKKGTSLPNEAVLISAHYDSVPNCPGADDNGTGVAGVLEAARVLATKTHDRTLIVACWDEEENGLIGSRAYVEKVSKEKLTIKANFVLEMIGYKSDAPNSQKLPQGFSLLFAKQNAEIKANQNKGDFIAIIGDAASKEAGQWMQRYARSVSFPAQLLLIPETLKNSPLIADLRRSDHAGFWAKNYPGMMITDTANFRNQAYHCSNNLKDSIDRLDHDFAKKVIQITVGAAAKMLEQTN